MVARRGGGCGGETREAGGVWPAVCASVLRPCLVPNNKSTSCVRCDLDRVNASSLPGKEKGETLELDLSELPWDKNLSGKEAIASQVSAPERYTYNCVLVATFGMLRVLVIAYSVHHKRSQGSAFHFLSLARGVPLSEESKWPLHTLKPLFQQCH